MILLQETHIPAAHTHLILAPCTLGLRSAAALHPTAVGASAMSFVCHILSNLPMIPSLRLSFPLPTTLRLAGSHLTHQCLLSAVITINTVKNHHQRPRLGQQRRGFFKSEARSHYAGSPSRHPALWSLKPVRTSCNIL
ncbi:hypothetical protein B0H13DRAFT_1067958 [Mycena leptocephala]|nr:hypothetical protein B0H13DRAFT_1067958 [Mycena leptocephala]